MEFREQPTLDAISRLEPDYPYAAALLTYVVVERLLKVHLLENRAEWKYADSFGRHKMNRGPHERMNLGALAATLSETEFFTGVVCHMTLGEVEHALAVPDGGRSATDRNEVMHSNLYLGADEATLSDDARKEKNHKRRVRAMEHLDYVVERYTDFQLREEFVAERKPR